MTELAKIIEPSWDFRGVNTKQDTHCYHSYPAMMIPHIARRLIEEYGVQARALFDPYCGTGTSLVEGSLAGIDVYGTDLNPMARLIARTKVTTIDPQVLDSHLEEFNNYVYSLNFGLSKTETPLLPDFGNIGFWFKPATINKLAMLRKFIFGMQDEKVRDFFLVAFSETVRECSLTRNGEFKLYRMPEKQREAFAPDVYSVMSAKLARNRVGLMSYLRKINGRKFKSCVYDFNSSDTTEKIEENSIDIVVTSPPYGDSRTTVAYGQFSQLSNQWLDADYAKQIDRRLMGGKPRKVENTGISLLDTAVQKVAAVDAKRAAEVFSFYTDYRASIRNVAATMKRHAYACYVVGNRRVKNTVLATDEITRVLFEEQGFRHERTIIRNIPNKRMPSKNSPTNITGATAETMNKEYIVIMQKI